MSDHDPADGAEHRALAPPTGDQRPAGPERADRAADAEFAAFYRGTLRRLTAFLLNHGASLPTAADIAQDTMVKAYRRWSEITHPAAWVHTVASRALARHIADIREEPVEHVPEPTSLLPHPDRVAQWEVHHDVLRLLRGLPPRQRQIMAWTFDDYTPAQIAGQLGMTPEAVRASLLKARRTLAARLRERKEEQ